MTSIGILSPPLIDVPIIVHVRSGGRPFGPGDWVGLFMLDAAGQATSTSLAVTPPRPLQLPEGRVVPDGAAEPSLTGSVSRELSATAHPTVAADPATGLLATGAPAPPNAALRAPASAAIVSVPSAASPSASRAGSTATSPPPPPTRAAVEVSDVRDRSPGVPTTGSQSEDSTSRRRHRDGSTLLAAVSPPPASPRPMSGRHPSWAGDEANADRVEQPGSGEPRVRQFNAGRPIAWQMLPTGYTATTCSFVLDPRLVDVHRDAATGAIAPVRLAVRLIRQTDNAPRAPSPSATTTHGGMRDGQAVDAECTVQLVSPLHAAQVCVRPGFTLDVHFAFTRDDTVIAWHGGAPGAGTPMLHYQHDFSLVHEGSGIEVSRGPVAVGCGVLHMPMPRLAGRYLVLLRDPRHQIDLLRYPVEVTTGHEFRLVLAPAASAIQPTTSAIALEIVSDMEGGRGRILGAGVDASVPQTESSPTARRTRDLRVTPPTSPSQLDFTASAAASPPPRQPQPDVAEGDAQVVNAEAGPEVVADSAFHIEAFTPFDVRVVASHAGAVKHGDELLILRYHGGEVWDPISAPTARFPLARQDGTWRGIILPPGRFGVALGLRHERAVLIGATHWVVVCDAVPPPAPLPNGQLQQLHAPHYRHQQGAQPQHGAHGHHPHADGMRVVHMHDRAVTGPMFGAPQMHNHPHPAVYQMQGHHPPHAPVVQWQQVPSTLGAVATHEFGYFPVPADMTFRGPHTAQPYMGGTGETRLGSGHAAGPMPGFVPARTPGVGPAASAAMPPTARPWGPLPPTAPRPIAQYPPFIANLLGTAGADAAPPPTAPPAAGSTDDRAGGHAEAGNTAVAPHHASPVPVDPEARPALRTVDTQRNADGSQTTTTTTYSSSLCMCCYEHQMCVMLRPCRHVCLCENCELQLRGTSDACPICRTPIQASERVFLP